MGSPQHERHTVAPPVDRSGGNRGKDFNSRWPFRSKRGSDEIEADRISHQCGDGEKKGMLGENWPHEERILRASTQGKQCV